MVGPGRMALLEPRRLLGCQGSRDRYISCANCGTQEATHSAKLSKLDIYDKLEYVK